MEYFSIRKWCLQVAALLVLSTSMIQAQETGGGVFSLGISDDATVAFKWTANTEPNLAGYRLYVGTVPGVYGGYVDVGNTTRFRLGDLIRGMTYYFALTAYNTAGIESELTPELSTQIPLVTPVIPQAEGTIATNEPPYFEPLPEFLVIEEGTTNRGILLLGVHAASSITATSSAPELIPDPQVTYFSPGTLGVIMLEPVPGATGTATVTVTAAGDGTNTFSRSLLVMVQHPNSPPAISTIPNLWLAKNRIAELIAFTVTDAESASENLEVFVTSSNPDALPVSGLMLTGESSTRGLMIDPSNGRTGVSTVTLIVSDGTASTSVSFDVTIQNLL